MYKAIPASLCMLSCGAAQAQQVISGTVKDKEAKPVDAANVALLKAADSTWLQSAITQADGSFSFKEGSKDALLLCVRAAGYSPAYVQVKELTSIAIQLMPAGKELQEVVVKSKAPTIQNGLGKLTVNFDEAAAPAGGNALDLLRKSPGVVVGGNGDVSMNGKGVLVIIDDKQTYLSATDLSNYLQSLPASEVAQIELMSQPSAKYDAEGNTGIINIKTRSSKKSGFNGIASISYGQTMYPGTFNTANFHYKKNKLSLFTNAAYLHTTGFMNQQQTRNTTDVAGALTSTFNQNSFLKETFEDYNLNMGGEYAFSEKFATGGSVQGIYHTNREKDRTTATIADYVSPSVVYNESVNNRGFTRDHLHTNGYMRYQPKKGQELTADIDYILLSQRDAQLLQSHNYDEQGNGLPGDVIMTTRFPRKMNVYVAKADYIGSFKKDLKIEAGIKSSYLTNQSDAVYNNQDSTGVWSYNTALSNYYTYHENINAAYLNFSKKLSARWQAQLGLRAEQTNISVVQQVNDQHFSRSFTNLFPTAFVSWQVADNHNLELNFGRRIQRPTYQDLNPFAFYTSQYAYHSGNPYLLPQFRNTIGLKHSYRNMLITEVSYARQYNIITDVIEYDSAAKVLHQLPQNIANKQNAHGSVSFNKELWSWWQFSSSYDCYYNSYEDSNHKSVASWIGHSFSLSNEFNFKTWTINTYSSVNSADLQSLTQRSGANVWMHGSVAKKIWNDTATIKLRIDDPFDLYRYKEQQTWNGVQTASVSQWATQGVNFSFTYRFGKQADIKKREHAVDEDRRM